MFFKRTKESITIDLSKVSEDNIFVIKNAYPAVSHYIISGKCQKGVFSINDNIMIQENGCNTLEGYIDKIKTFDRIDIYNTSDETNPNNSILLYIVIKDNDEHQKITNKNLIVK